MEPAFILLDVTTKQQSKIWGNVWHQYPWESQTPPAVAKHILCFLELNLSFTILYQTSQSSRDDLSQWSSLGFWVPQQNPNFPARFLNMPGSSTLTLFLASFRLNIKLRYLLLYLLSVSRKKENSSFSVLLATFAALSVDTFRSDSLSLKGNVLRSLPVTSQALHDMHRRKGRRCSYRFKRMSFRESRTFLLICSTEGFLEAAGDVFAFFASCRSCAPADVQ